MIYMGATVFETNTAKGAMSWMLQRGMIVRSSTKDPETFATIQGYIVSEELRDRIGSNLVRLLGKAAKGNGMGRVTIRDALLTATMGAVLAIGKTQLSEEEMMQFANIIWALLPFERLETAGVTQKPLRSLARDRRLVGKVMRLCSAAR